MKLSETCTCGGSFRVEHGDHEVVTHAAQNWRTGHHCGNKPTEIEATGGGDFAISDQAVPSTPIPEKPGYGRFG